jgi:hypothetical protein
MYTTVCYCRSSNYFSSIVHRFEYLLRRYHSHRPISSSLLYSALPSLGTSHFDFSSINMGGGIDEEILVNPTDRHYCSDCIVYIAVYGYRVLTEVAALMLCFHLTYWTPTITHPI